MKYLDEYRDRDAAGRWLEAIRRLVTRPWTLMEVCGGQTHAIVQYGLDELLPPSITLLHGPGCPVCVTPLEKIDRAIALARRPEVIFCSFGDMLRVPGTEGDLLSVKAAGGDVRIVYSPLDALRLAKQHPDRQVVFFAVGFETTAPGNALVAYQARQQQLTNFSLLVSHVLVPPALEAILGSPSCRVQGFLAAGHVCAVMGYTEYHPISTRHRVPIVVTGFEPLDLLQGVHMCIRQLEEGRAEVENQYARVVTEQGNPHARRVMAEVFDIVDRSWRGIGEIKSSGLGLRPAYANFDAERRFARELEAVGARPEPSECQSGLVLQGIVRPTECPAFGGRCTPEHPLGATMVSGEGACAAYYRHRSVMSSRQ
jgi:hydrogenase expression/formation protein HypD